MNRSLVLGVVVAGLMTFFSPVAQAESFTDEQVATFISSLTFQESQLFNSLSDAEKEKVINEVITEPNGEDPLLVAPGPVVQSNAPRTRGGQTSEPVTPY